MKLINKIICKIFGHKFEKYPSINEVKCLRCGYIATRFGFYIN